MNSRGIDPEPRSTGNRCFPTGKIVRTKSPLRNAQVRKLNSLKLKSVVGRALVVFLLFGVVVTGSQSQSASDPKSPETKASRKLKSGQPPEYPELARQMNIKGTARVMVTVAADGVVKEVKEVGGHPLLIDALIRAVKKWKYEPAPKETVIEVKAEFGNT